ncbi:MAG: hypothetical protein V3S15_07220 [Woeseiaceae bacterium]
MANIMRWRYGETNLVTLPVDVETDIEIGDLVLLEGGGKGSHAEPVSSVRVGMELAGAQKVVVDSFVGVAMQRSRAGDTQAIRIATSGVFEFDCYDTRFELGDRVGPEFSDTEHLEDQSVVKVDYKSPGLSIGRVAKRVATADTKVLVEINSTVMRKDALEGETACVETKAERPSLIGVDLAADTDESIVIRGGRLLSVNYCDEDCNDDQMVLRILVKSGPTSPGDCTVTMKR